MKSKEKSILILNGSPFGSKGNCSSLIQFIRKKYPFQYKTLHLANDSSLSEIKKQLTQADGFIFVTGTYWDSWGSPLQKFLEEVTPLEGTDVFLGKPCCVLVLNHSVGGKAVLSRLQGVLSTLGLLIPPMSGWVYSLLTEMTTQQHQKSKHAADFWSLDDLDIVFSNFQKSMNLNVKWQSWSVDRKNFKTNWLKNKK